MRRLPSYAPSPYAASALLRPPSLPRRPCRRTLLPALRRRRFRPLPGFRRGRLLRRFLRARLRFGGLRGLALGHLLGLLLGLLAALASRDEALGALERRLLPVGVRLLRERR